MFSNYFQTLYLAFRVKAATNQRKHIKTDDYHLQTWKFRKRIKIQLNSVRNILWMFYQSVCVESLTVYTCQNLSFSVYFSDSTVQYEVWLSKHVVLISLQTRTTSFFDDFVFVFVVGSSLWAMPHTRTGNRIFSHGYLRWENLMK